MDGCRFMLVISLKLIRRLILPPTLRSGLLLPATPSTSPSSTLILSALGFVIGGTACVGAPALKLKSSRKFSRSLANLINALSKSNPAKFPLLSDGPLIVILLRLLCMLSSSSRVWIELRASLEGLFRRCHELFRECRAEARGVPEGGKAGASPSLPSSIVASTAGEGGTTPLDVGGPKTWSLYERESIPAIQK
ncbi:hypothetical protein B0O99DRAFT_130795 [Bisporella sp. PMI_857]|nr:hypothetical protein B0O99DRAFT_130795 [Bisporella sp. PMI_857]